jgi:hypothetical protein
MKTEAKGRTLIRLLLGGCGVIIFRALSKFQAEASAGYDFNETVYICDLEKWEFNPHYLHNAI